MSTQAPLRDLATRYHDHGWCRSPYRLDDRSVALLLDRVKTISRQQRPEIVHEKDNKTIRAIHGCHAYDDLCAALVRHPHLVALAETLIGKAVYLYQFKINLKQARHGAAWPWHQDFTFWHLEDGMPHPDAVTMAINLDNTHRRNAPLTVLSGTHRLGTVSASDDRGPSHPTHWHNHVSANPTHTVDPGQAERIAQAHGRNSLTGPAGTLHAFHPNIVHSSPHNDSAHPRTLLLITYNATDNAPLSPTRPPFLVNPLTTRLTPQPSRHLQLTTR